jgi:hypothetical protein
VVHVDATLIRADVAWESLGERHADAVMARDGESEADHEAATVAARPRAERDGKRTAGTRRSA